MGKIAKTIKLVKLKLRNQQINKRVNRFIEQNKDKPLPPRESDLKPEIVIPCYNHGQYLEAALKSVPPGVPVTIINDLSTDNSLEIIKELKNRFDFKLINNEVNLNMHGSLNKAVELSNNNLFIMLNADDVLNNLTIKTIMYFYEQLPTIRLLGGGALAFSDDSCLRFNQILPDFLPYIPKHKIYNQTNAKHYQHMNDINMTMSGSSFLKSAWQAVGGFYPYKKRVCTYDDRDFHIRVSSLFDVAIIEEPLAFYRVNTGIGVGQQ